MRTMRKREGGFTLIELITVIIILGILAAVVAPKYFNMSAQAENAALKGALSEGVARVNMSYAQFILSNSGTAPTTIGQLQGANMITDIAADDIGDYTLAYTQAGGASTDITITAKKDSDATKTLSQVIPWP